jgi:sugar-phosphatase
MARHPAALLLDLDGTLVDSEPIHRQTYRSWFAHRGWVLEEATLELFTGRRADDVFTTERGPWDGEDPAVLLDEVLRFVPSGARPEAVPGAARLLSWADEHGIPLALVTSAGRAWADEALADLGGLAIFDVVVTRAEVSAGKPDPAGYRLACELLGVEPAASVAFEDSPAGVRAACAAGIGTVVGVATTWKPEDLVAAGASQAAPELGAMPHTVVRGDQAP